MDKCYYKITNGDFYINIVVGIRSLFTMNNPPKDGWVHLPFVKQEGIGEGGFLDIYSPFYKMVKK